MNQEKDLNAEHFFPISDKKIVIVISFLVGSLKLPFQRISSSNEQIF